MKRKILGIVFLCILLLSVSVGIFFYVFLFPITVEQITYEVKEKTIIAHLSFSNPWINGTCNTKETTSQIENKMCQIEVLNEPNKITIQTSWNKKEFEIDPKIDDVLNFELQENEIYMAVGEKRSIDLSVDKLGDPDITGHFTSSDESILKIEGTNFEGVGNGTAIVKVQVGNITKDLKVTVSNLYHLPLLEPKKQYLQCGLYTQEDNDLLDKVLEYKVKKAGEKTRAGVVAALRFLTLEFPYQLNYFYENGRLNNNTGGAKVDGEGRFYHYGLYLNTSRFAKIKKYAKSYGPATWGCPLMNWQDESGFKRGVKYPNGLDCSGFISWAFLNGRIFDENDETKDTGAGDNKERNDDLSDLGSHEWITKELLEKNILKAGDIIASDGHMAMIGGIKDGVVYVAESTTYYHGVVMHPYTYQELLDTPYLNYVILMDDYYKTYGNGNGNYTDYWEYWE